MKCPVCTQSLKPFVKDCFICPGEHGALIFNKHLRVKDKDLISKIDPDKTQLISAQRNHLISCPHCGSQMYKVDYNSTGIVIDSCLKCHYRWLDKGEFIKIKNHKPQFDPVDTAIIMSLDKQIGKAQQDKVLNPAYSLSDNSLSSPGSLGFAAVRAVIVGLRHSWFTRIATVAILIITALMYEYVIKEFNK